MNSSKALLCVLLASASVAHPSESEERDVIVEKLYRDYSLEFVAFRPDGPRFMDQSKSVLEEYLTPGLASLIIKDRECYRRQKTTCWIDNPSPWIKADLDRQLLDIDVGEDGDVIARFSKTDGTTSLELKYKVVKTGTTWRIDDFLSEGFSLRQHLQRSL